MGHILVSNKAKDIICSRINMLSEEYVSTKNKEIEIYNAHIDELNEQNHIRRVNSGYIYRYEKLHHKKKYTFEALAIELNEDYTDINITPRKLNDYRLGTSCPPLDFIYAFSRKMHVSFEFILGYSDIKDVVINEISRQLSISSNSARILNTLKRNPFALSALDSILSSDESSETMLSNLYLNAYYSYCKQRERDTSLMYDKNYLLQRYTYTEAFTTFAENQIIEHNKENFESDYRNDQLNKQDHQQDNGPDIPDSKPIIIKADPISDVTAVPIEEKDGNS